MAKSLWKGDISFGLVSIPVSLISTEETREIHFHLLDSKSKSRVRYQRISEDSGKEVPWADIVKGYEYEKGQYIIVNEAAFEKKDPDLFKSIDIEEFVDFREIDTLYLDKPYYLIPESKNKKAYVLLREALKKSGKVGIAKIMLRTREYLSLILAHGHALLRYLVHFKDELRDETAVNLPREALSFYKVSAAEMKMALRLIDDMAARWEPEKYHNHYQETMRQWLEQEAEKQKPASKKAKRQNSEASVADFISLLKESINKSRKKPAKKA